MYEKRLTDPSLYSIQHHYPIQYPKRCKTFPSAQENG